jgi:hypothetical protein
LKFGTNIATLRLGVNPISFFNKFKEQSMAYKIEVLPKMLTPVFTVSFPNVFEVSQYDNKYALHALWHEDNFTDKDKSLMKAMLDEEDRIIKSYLKGMTPKSTIIRDGDSQIYKDGEKAGQVYTGYKGLNFSKMKNATSQPFIIKPDRVTPITNPDEFYGGCKARAYVQVLPYGLDYKTGLKNPATSKTRGAVGTFLKLLGVMKVADGIPTGGMSRAVTDFSTVDFDEDGMEE